MKMRDKNIRERALICQKKAGAKYGSEKSSLIGRINFNIY